MKTYVVEVEVCGLRYEVAVSAKNEEAAEKLVESFDAGRLFNYLEAEMDFSITDVTESESEDDVPLTAEEIGKLRGRK